jgi:pyruvate dehydrogenase E1 component beta subunit
LLAAIQDDDPVVYIEHRWLHEDEADVGAEYFTTPIGRATVVRRGRDVTIVAAGPMVSEALKAAQNLESSGILAEVIDLRTLRPLDMDTVIASVAKTGRLVVADSDWAPCGIAGEIIAGVAEQALDALRARPIRVTWPDSAVPSSQAIEPQFYPGAREIQAAAVAVCEGRAGDRLVASTVKDFSGPF